MANFFCTRLTLGLVHKQVPLEQIVCLKGMYACLNSVHILQIDSKQLFCQSLACKNI